MYWFGKTSRDWKQESWDELKANRLAFSLTPVQDIIDLLDAFSRSFVPDDELVVALQNESGFSLEETKKTLGLLPGLLRKESLEKRLRAELGTLSVLDGFVKLQNQSALVKASPLGVILHVTAGNVFLSSIDSLLMGLLTKNLSIMKVSSQNKIFPQCFAERLRDFDEKSIVADKFAVLHWKGGDTATEDFIKNKVNAIVAWGGEEMIESYRQGLSPKVKFLDFGPKISLQVLSKNGLDRADLSNVAQKIVDDVTPWNQGACASPQNLYLQTGSDEKDLLEELDRAFSQAQARAPISDDEATEILKETYRGYYSMLMGEGAVRVGAGHLLHLEDNKFIKPSPLNRSLIIKRFTDEKDLYTHLEPFSYFLQSCSYLLGEEEKNSYLQALSLTGLKRFAPLGTITWGMDGAPHDGRFVMRELVEFIGDERRSVDYGVRPERLQDSRDIKTFFKNSEHPQGYVFSSGGTTGEPKFVHFSYEEFDFSSELLAQNFRAQGIRAGMTVANLFVAGNLWSSFMAVEKALAKIGAIQLPIGGLSSQENTAMYLARFKPDVVMGIPSLIISLAEFMQEKSMDLVVPQVFYAGEALSGLRQSYLERVWKTMHFGSAGYASVDAGVIGYQCLGCGPGEHHVFSDFVHLDIVEDEGIVTSSYRDTMPIKNYRTGDKMKWIEACSCGSKDPRFKLLGRIDNTIQVWSCRLNVDDVEKALGQFDVRTFQLIISESREANLTREKLNLLVETHKPLEREAVLEAIYENSRDVRDSLSLENFMKDLSIEEVDLIERNQRTGKISVVKDLRH